MEIIKLTFREYLLPFYSDTFQQGVQMTPLPFLPNPRVSLAIAFHPSLTTRREHYEGSLHCCIEQN